jgi:aldehyde:ferredoxin oxidoreductase
MHDNLYATKPQIEELKPLGILEPPVPDDTGPQKVAVFRLIQFKRIVNDSLVVCLFLPYSYQQLANVTAAVTGWDTGVAEQLRVAERIVTMTRLFNMREGFTAADDKLPLRFFQPKTDGVLSDKPLDPGEYERARSYYYTLMGWDAQTGMPLPEKVEELGITWP